MSWMVVFKFNLNSFGKLKNKRKFLALPNKLKEGSVAIIVLSRFDVLFYFNFSGIYYKFNWFKKMKNDLDNQNFWHFVSNLFLKFDAQLEI